jgi:aldose 1-epimerase
MLQEWPWSMSARHTTRLQEGVLQIALEVTNDADTVMPLGVGLHPYFRAPLVSAGERDRCLVQVDATHWWEQDQAFPTGRTVTPSGAIDIRSRRPLGDLPAQATARGKSINELYARFGQPSAYPLSATGITASIADPDERVVVEMSTSDTFRALVVFTPTWTQSVSLEPHTCVPDAFNVEAAGMSAGVIALEPGRTWKGWAQFVARAFEP